MSPPAGAVRKEKLSDTAARAIKRMIKTGNFKSGDRLPTIAEMAGRFNVGAPTLREALKKLQGAGILDVKHGSGIFVAENHDSLFVHNPVADRRPSKKVVLDMLEARLAVEPFTAGLAAEKASDPQIEKMEALLDQARVALTARDYETLAEASLGFHREISLASHNSVISQLLALISGLFQIELYTVLNIYGNTERDYQEHRSILDAIMKRNRNLAVRRMRNHLTNVCVAIEQYYEEHPEEVAL